MSGSTVGAALGAVLALTWILLGFWAFVWVGLAMLIGATTARVLDGRLDLRSLVNVFRGGRSSQ